MVKKKIRRPKWLRRNTNLRVKNESVVTDCCLMTRILYFVGKLAFLVDANMTQ